MLDLLSSKGTIEILDYIITNPNVTSSEINKHFTSDHEVIFKSATIYRRIKELEMAGFITRNPPDSNFFIATEKAKEVIEQRIQQRPEITKLKRSRRTLLRSLEQHEGINVAQLHPQTGLSPNTVVQSLQELSDLGLVEEINQNKLSDAGTKSNKKKKRKPGRPAKRLKLTKKGKDVYQQQIEIEEELR